MRAFLGFERLFSLFFLDHDLTAIVVAAFRASVVRLLQGVALGANGESRTVDGVTGSSVHPSVGLGSFTLRDTHCFLHSFPVIFRGETLGRLVLLDETF